MSEENKDQNQDQKNADNADDRETNDKNKSAETMIPKARFDQVNEKKKQAEEELKTVAEALKEDVPEEFRDVIPDLPPVQLIQWLRNAAKKGLFVKPSADSPDSKRPHKQQTEDLSGLSPAAMMSRGYGKT